MRRHFRGRAWAPLAVLSAFTLGACAGETADDDMLEGADEASMDADGDAAGETPAEPRELGPVDGRDLPATDLDRVAIGDMAPDFTLETYRGETLTLSENRGQREILLVFYRGAW